METNAKPLPASIPQDFFWVDTIRGFQQPRNSEDWWQDFITRSIEDRGRWSQIREEMAKFACITQVTGKPGRDWVHHQPASQPPVVPSSMPSGESKGEASNENEDTSMISSNEDQGPSESIDAEGPARDASPPSSVSRASSEDTEMGGMGESEE